MHRFHIRHMSFSLNILNNNLYMFSISRLKDSYIIYLGKPCIMFCYSSRINSQNILYITFDLHTSYIRSNKVYKFKHLDLLVIFQHRNRLNKFDRIYYLYMCHSLLYIIYKIYLWNLRNVSSSKLHKYYFV